MKLIWIHQNTKGEWTDDECLEFAKTQRNKQLAADLAVYRKRLLDEADTLAELLLPYREYLNQISTALTKRIENHMASLRKEAEGVSHA